MKPLWAVIVVGALAATTGCKRNGDSAAPPERVTNVAVEVLEPTEAADRIVISGTVAPWADVRVAAEVSGRIETCAVEEGAVVEPGAVLFEIDSSLLKAQVTQAEAAVAALRAEQDKVAAGARPEELAIALAKVGSARAAMSQARAAVEQAKASEANALRDLERTRKLFEQNVESEAKLDQMTTAHTVARRRREAADEQLRNAEEQLTAAQKQEALVREGARSEDRAGIAAKVAQAQAALNLARITLLKATVKSPIKGVLNKRLCDAGEYVGPGTPLADVVDVARVKVVAPVPERDISSVRLGAPKRMWFDLGRGDPVERTGRVIFVSQVADPRTLTFDVKIELGNADGRLRPGMIARVELVRDRLEDAIAVPFAAVIRDEDGYVAFVENGGEAHRREVTLGFFDGGRVVVTSGLSAGDRLIVQGQRFIADADRVRVAPAAGTTSAPAPTSAPAEGGRS